MWYCKTKTDPFPDLKQNPSDETIVPPEGKDIHNSESVCLRPRQCLPSAAIDPFFRSNSENPGRDGKVNQQRQSIHHGGDKRRSHYGRVDPDLLRGHRQRTAHDLGTHHSEHQRQADHQSHRDGDLRIVHQPAIYDHLIKR